MAIVLGANWINVIPGDPAFSVGSNVCEYFELGAARGDDYWLEAQIVGNGEFVFNGRLFIPGQKDNGTIIDNFPKGPSPNSWTKRPRVDGEGYELVAENKTLFGYRVVPTPIPAKSTESRVCFVTTNIYAAGGQLVAETLPNEFRLHGRAKIGRGGVYVG